MRAVMVDTGWANCLRHTGTFSTLAKSGHKILRR